MQKAYTNRRSKGCFDYSTKAYRLANFRYDTCIGNFSKPIGYLVEAFLLYEKGVLPFGLTLGEQPNKIIEVFDLFSERRNQKQEAEAKKQQANQRTVKRG